jgi:hypothetical protein
MNTVSSRIPRSRRRLNTDRSDSEGELTHGVESGRASVEQLLNKLGDSGTSSPVLGKSSDLLLRGDLTSDEEPEEGLGKGLGATGGLGEQLLAFGNGLAAETDALLWR